MRRPDWQDYRLRVVPGLRISGAIQHLTPAPSWRSTRSTRCGFSKWPILDWWETCSSGFRSWSKRGVDSALHYEPGACVVEPFEARRPICEDSPSTLHRPLVVLWANKWRVVDRAEDFAARTASIAPAPSPDRRLHRAMKSHGTSQLNPVRSATQRVAPYSRGATASGEPFRSLTRSC